MAALRDVHEVRYAMSEKTSGKILSLVFLIAIFLTAIIFNSQKPRVMILHSYHLDYAWTREIDVGFERVLKKWVGYSVVRHYMDTKKHKDKEWLKRSGIIARRAIDRAEPHVLIAVDDFAQSLAAKYYVNKPGIQIVFAGVNGSVEPYGYNGADNVTGIFERKQLRPIKETVLALEARKRKIAGTENHLSPKLLYLMDPSASIKMGKPFIDNYDWSPVKYRGAVIAENYPHWKQLVLEKGKGVDYILISNYRKIPRSETDDKFMNPKEVMAWTEENSPVPVIGINAFNVEDGAMLSVGVSPYEQGEVAAKLAQRILEEGIKARDIPFMKNKMYVIAMNENLLVKRNLSLPSIYEAFGRATENFIEK